MRESYDYIVVGGGAAGSVVAGRLSERASNRVLLLEAGGPDDALVYKVPGACGLAALRSDSNYNWQTNSVPELNDRSLVLAQGRLLGGSSSINGMLYTRGHLSDYDEWERMGCPGWGSRDVLPSFKKLETNFRGASEWHGDAGPVHVTQSKGALPICGLFLEAAKEAGFAVVDDLNCNVVDAFGLHDINVYKGRRISAAQAFLKSAAGRPNLTIATNASVQKLLIENGRTVGVSVQHLGEMKRITAEREVIVAAGAVQSPQLLMLSGLGPADMLRSFGIPVIHDLPNVGKNYQNHPYYALSFTCAAPVTGQSYVNPLRAAWSGLVYAVARGGIFGDTLFPAGGFFRTDPDTMDVPDMQALLMPSLMLQAGMDGPSLSEIMRMPHGFLVGLNIGTPASRGEIKLRSGNPADPPEIIPNYFGDPRDMQTMMRGVRRMRAMMRGKSMRGVIKEELVPGASVGDDDASLEASIRQNAGTYYHQSGTCRMGSDSDAVVDPQLRVNGVSGLRVADASIMPRLPNANTNLPAMMIGEKAASIIAAGN